MKTIKAECPHCNTTNEVEKKGKKYSLAECKECGKVSLMENVGE